MLDVGPAIWMVKEGHLVLGEAVLLEERRRGLAVDSRAPGSPALQQADSASTKGLRDCACTNLWRAERLGSSFAVQLRVSHLVALHAQTSSELTQQQFGMRTPAPRHAGRRILPPGDVLSAGSLARRDGGSCV